MPQEPVHPVIPDRLELGYWDLVLVCDLELVIWSFPAGSAKFTHTRPVLIQV